MSPKGEHTSPAACAGSRKTEFRRQLDGIAPARKDGWVDAAFGITELPDDEPLPRGCVPYLPCAADLVLSALDYAEVSDSDVFVDLGAGLGRAALLAHLCTGARAVGVELQPNLVQLARSLTERLALPQVQMVEGDARRLEGPARAGTVFFMYCPFSGVSLEPLLRDFEALAQDRNIRLCTVDLPLPASSWLEEAYVSPRGELVVYRSLASGAPRSSSPCSTSK